MTYILTRSSEPITKSLNFAREVVVKLFSPILATCSRMTDYFLYKAQGTLMQEELQASVLFSCCFLAEYLAVAGMNLLVQLSDRIHHFTALNSVHVRKLG